ncbi:MAG: ribbon-helix-helix domain-containing protein [Pseudomonadota bacterium]
MTEYSRPQKRSLTLCGHRTSVTLEEPFWRRFREIADERSISVNALAARIDAARPAGVGLASAIRVYVLSDALERPEATRAASVAA